MGAFGEGYSFHFGNYWRNFESLVSAKMKIYPSADILVSKMNYIFVLYAIA